MVCEQSCQNYRVNQVQFTDPLSGSVRNLIGFSFEGIIVKQIPLTQGQFALVDDGDYRWLAQWKWHAMKDKNTFYAARNELSGGKRRYVYMHRLILNTPAHQETDHINHNGLDNRRCNLRICSAGQNRRNQLPRKHYASKYKGVSRQGTKWQANICCNYEAIHIGTYDSEVEAAKAYDAKAKLLHGEFALTNFRTVSSVALSKPDTSGGGV